MIIGLFAVSVWIYGFNLAIDVWMTLVYAECMLILSLFAFFLHVSICLFFACLHVFESFTAKVLTRPITAQVLTGLITSHHFGGEILCNALLDSWVCEAC